MLRPHTWVARVRGHGLQRMRLVRQRVQLAQLRVQPVLPELRRAVVVLHALRVRQPGSENQQQKSILRTLGKRLITRGGCVPVA